MRQPVKTIAALTCKTRDSWWTVVFVDPIAVRLVWLAQPYRWLSANFFTGVAFILSIAAAASFAQATPGYLIAGAGLFYASFVFDCVDGKIARLRGGGSFVGAWLDFMVDRLRFLLALAGIFGGQFRETGDTMFLIVGVAAALLNLLHYVNGAEIEKISSRMQNELAVVAVEHEGDTRRSMTVLMEQTRTLRWFRAIADGLLRRRIRPRLFSGVEFEHAICVLAPATGLVLAVSQTALILDLVFEVAVIGLLIRSARQVARLLAAGEPDPDPDRVQRRGIVRA